MSKNNVYFSGEGSFSKQFLRLSIFLGILYDAQNSEFLLQDCLIRLQLFPIEMYLRHWLIRYESILMFS